MENTYQTQQTPLTPQTPPKNWLVESILVTIFCCLPFGIVGIINAANVNSRFAAGDYNGATQASKEAGKWTKISFWIGIGVTVISIALWLIFGTVFFFMAGDNNNDY